MDINDFMKDIRKKEGYSQQEMADKIGVSKNMIFMIEKKERNVTEELLNKIVKNFPKYETKILHIFYENKLAAKLIDESGGNAVREVKYKERLDHMENQTMIMLVVTGFGVMLIILVSMLMMFNM